MRLNALVDDFITTPVCVDLHLDEQARDFSPRD